MEFIYGINPAFEVIMTGKRKIHEGFICDGSKPKLKKICSLLEARGIPVSHLERGRLIDMTGNKYHQGVVLKVSNYPYVSFDSLLGNKRLLLLDNIEDPQNLGAILRSAEVFGFKSVLLSMRGTPEVYPSVVKVSSGATEHLLIANDHNANSFATKAKENGFTIISLDQNGKNTFEEIKSANPEKILLVIGGEDKSVGQFILNESDFILGIQQKGRINSLNASVAAGVGMYIVSQI
ncbi:MAG: 23S rRNA (guanosine(2251)-2'-O)-methyltransferase RlmB [Lentisphaerota bacterium]